MEAGTQLISVIDSKSRARDTMLVSGAALVLGGVLLVSFKAETAKS